MTANPDGRSMEQLLRLVRNTLGANRYEHVRRVAQRHSTRILLQPSPPGGDLSGVEAAKILCQPLFAAFSDSEDL